MAKAVNLLATPATNRILISSALSPSGYISQSKMLDLYVPNTFLSFHRHPNPNPRNGGNAIFLPHCSTRPNTERDSASSDNSNASFGLNSNPEFQEPTEPTPNQNLKSSNPSFSRGLVFDLGAKHSWDGSEIGSPVVKRYLGDEEERWYMWYHGSPIQNADLDSIGLAVSSNGIHWERGGGPVRSSGDTGLVMNCSKDWWAFDTESIRPREVVIMSSSKVRANNAVYWLYYTGYSSEKVDFLDNNSLGLSLQNPERARFDGDENGGNGGSSRVYKSLPGLAMSQDGRHWARIEGEHHSGALFDVGSNGEWDSMFIASPQVVFHGNGDLRMYYHSLDVQNGTFAVGIARSRDGIRWVKLGKILGGGRGGDFDELGVMNPQVVRNRKNGEYLMAYEGIDANGGRSIGLAVSADGLKNWQRAMNEAILRPSEDGGWDSRGVGSPCLVQMDGDEDKWRLYYRGIGMVVEMGIGMAVSEGSEMKAFRRWSGFHLQD